MNRIVKERYPLSNLPEDLREGLPENGEARVVVEIVPQRRGYTYAELLAIRDTLPVTTDDPVKRVRALRDEWD